MSAPALRFVCEHRFGGAGGDGAGFALDAAFEVREGVGALFGVSGAGKSTCLAMIAGLLRPDRGRIEIGGRVVTDTSGDGRAVFVRPERRAVGLVFQDLRLFPHMSVRANLAYALPRRERGGAVVERVARVLDLSGLLDRAPGTLSGGQRQRVALGRAIVSRPSVLLLDEPLTGLDEGLKEHVVGYLERIGAEWKTPTILVSHDQVLVRRLASSVVVLDGGRVVAAGPTGPTMDRAVISGMRTAPGPVNLVRVDGVEALETHAEGRVGAQRFYLGGAEAGGGRTVWVRFGAEDVALSVGDIPRLSMRNHLRGRVQEMVPIDAGRRLYVGVDVGGQRVWSQITEDARTDLGIEFETEVVCLVKAAAVRIVD